MVTAFQNLDSRMSLKPHFLQTHLDFLPSNLGAVGDEYNERIYLGTAEVKARYKGKCDASMMGNCW